MPTALEQYIASMLRWLNVGNEEVTLLEVHKHSVVFLFERPGVRAKRLVFQIGTAADA